jgi:hypothetical protein
MQTILMPLTLSSGQVRDGQGNWDALCRPDPLQLGRLPPQVRSLTNTCRHNNIKT